MGLNAWLQASGMNPRFHRCFMIQERRFSSVVPVFIVYAILLFNDRGLSGLRGLRHVIVLHLNFCIILTLVCNIMSTSRRNSKGKAPMTNVSTQNLPDDEAQCIAHIRFGLAKMEEFYVSFKGKRSIHAETQFEVESFRNDFPDIYYHIGMRDWGPFTIPIDPYSPGLVWEFYASYRARKSILKHKGRLVRCHACHLCGCATKKWTSPIGNQFSLLG
ncbi:hypothetical protein HAX54_039600 [Datura stramonium]|uniref:Uncharacterized protein n=1 Tax=Datura stramonium TaxID=4076 RepID=A0ABS8VPP3_DATST|nr:hypothetical protein [Datura stramonium]